MFQYPIKPLQSCVNPNQERKAHAGHTVDSLSSELMEIHAWAQVFHQFLDLPDAWRCEQLYLHAPIERTNPHTGGDVR